MLLDCAATAGRLPTVRSAVSNGRKPFIDGDGRSPWSRRRRDLVELHIADMGGADRLSEAQISLAKRCATLEVQLEGLEALMSKGEPVDLDLYARVSSHLRRQLETLGIQRAQKDITPSLSDIARRIRASKEGGA